MKRRIVSMMLVAAMGTALLAGCGGNTANSSTAETSNDTAKEDTAPVTETADTDAEHIVLFCICCLCYRRSVFFCCVIGCLLLCCCLLYFLHSLPIKLSPLLPQASYLRFFVSFTFPPFL